MTTNSCLADMECKNMIKVDPNKSTESPKKGAASSSSEALTSMVFLSISDYNRFGSLISYLRKDILKGNNNYPRTVTRSYDMLTLFKFASPRRHHTECTGDKVNRENCGGRCGRDHTFVQHTAPSGAVFISGLDLRTSYRIKCYSCEKWGHYENQCP